MAQKGAKGPKVDHKSAVAPHTPPRLDRDVQARIGEQLRTMYDELLQQPVPNRFVDLLKALDKVEKDDKEPNG